MTIAEKVIKPTRAGIFRSVFLYTGQGESTLLVIPTGNNTTDYMYVLVDCDKDNEPNEIDLVKMFKDLFKTNGELAVFINSHPHNDHIGGIKEVYDKIGFKEVWHSNHKPGSKHKEKYEDLKYVITEVGKANEYFLLGTNEENTVRTSKDFKALKKLGNIEYQVLSPAQYLCEDINEENQDKRDRRIHEQCAVIKFTYGMNPCSIMMTGDSDKAAWMDHITEYYKSKLPSHVLSASHHGSRSFFKNGEDDKEPYETHIEHIKPTYLIISAPKRDKSPYKHPHEDALKLYEKHLEADNILHLGKNLESVIVDIDANGKVEINFDKELIEEYGKGDDDNNESNNNGNTSKSTDYSTIYVGSQTTKIDNKPNG